MGYSVFDFLGTKSRIERKQSNRIWNLIKSKQNISTGLTCVYTGGEVVKRRGKKPLNFVHVIYEKPCVRPVS